MKKILALICIVGMALCLAGCGGPKADYSFATNRQMHDDFAENHGSDISHSVYTAEKYYQGKRIEFVIKVGPDKNLPECGIGDDMDFRHQWVMVEIFGFRDSNERSKAVKQPKVKLNGKFRQVALKKMVLGDKGIPVLTFVFDDVLVVDD